MGGLATAVASVDSSRLRTTLLTVTSCRKAMGPPPAPSQPARPGDRAGASGVRYLGDYYNPEVFRLPSARRENRRWRRWMVHADYRLPVRAHSPPEAAIAAAEGALAGRGGRTDPDAVAYQSFTTALKQWPGTEL